MPDHTGWVSLHRKTLENPVIMKDCEYFAIWCYLLLKATHKGREADFKGKTIKLNPGQLITGRKKIAEDLKISESKTQRVLKRFEIEHQIEQQTSTKNRLVKVLNWHKYQTTEQQLNNNRTTTEQQLNTNNNGNKWDNETMKEIVDLFHQKCTGLPKIQKLNNKRKKHLEARLNEFGKEKVIEAIEIASKSGFLNGNNQRGFKANFDFIVNSSNMLKILEGAYSNQNGKKKEASSDSEMIEYLYSKRKKENVDLGVQKYGVERIYNAVKKDNALIDKKGEIVI